MIKTMAIAPMFIFFPCCCSAIRFISISSEYSFLFYLPNVNATPIKKGKQLSEKQMVMTAWRKKAIFCIFSWWFYSFLPCSCKFEGNILKWNSCTGSTALRKTDDRVGGKTARFQDHCISRGAEASTEHVLSSMADISMDPVHWKPRLTIPDLTVFSSFIR